MDSNNQAQQAKNQTLEQGVAFEDLIRTKGWEFVKSYYQLKVQSFATQILVSEKPISEFEAERHQLVGLRNLLGYIDTSIKLLENERKHTTTTE